MQYKNNDSFFYLRLLVGVSTDLVVMVAIQ